MASIHYKIFNFPTNDLLPLYAFNHYPSNFITKGHPVLYQTTLYIYGRAGQPPLMQLTSHAQFPGHR